MSNLGKRQRRSLSEQQIVPSRRKRRRNIKDHEWRVLNFLIEERNLDRANISVILCGVPLECARLEKERNRHPVSILEKQAMRLGNVPSGLPPEIEIKLPIENLPWLKCRELIATDVLSCCGTENGISDTFGSNAKELQALSFCSVPDMGLMAGNSRTPIFDCIMGAILSVSNHLYDRAGSSMFESTHEDIRLRALVDLLTSEQAIPFLRVLYRKKTPTLAALFEILLRDGLLNRNERLIRDLAENNMVDLNKTVSGPWTAFHPQPVHSFDRVEHEALLPLEVAVRGNDTVMVKLLISLEADLNAPCLFHESLLRLAVSIDSECMVRLLINLGIRDQSHAILYYSSGNIGYQRDFTSTLPIARTLIEKASKTDLAPILPLAFRTASRVGNSDFIRLLLDKGADPYLRGPHYSSSLIAASDAGHSDIARMLLLHNPSDIPFDEWWEACLRAASLGRPAVMEVLLKHSPPFDTFHAMEEALEKAGSSASEQEALEVASILIGYEPGLVLGRFISQEVSRCNKEVSKFLLGRRAELDYQMCRTLRSAGPSPEGFGDVFATQRAMIWAIQSADVSDAECVAIIMSLANRSCDTEAPIDIYSDCNKVCMPRPTPLSTAIHSRPSIVDSLLCNVSTLDDPAALHAAVQTKNFKLLISLSKAVFQSADRPEAFIKQFGGEIFKQALKDDDLRACDILLEAGARPIHFSTHETFIHMAKTANADEFMRASNREVYIYSKYFRTNIPPICLVKALTKAITSINHINKMQALLDIGAPTNFRLDSTNKNQLGCSFCSKDLDTEENPLDIAFRNSNAEAVKLLLEHGAKVDDCLIVKALRDRQYCARNGTCKDSRPYIHECEDSFLDSSTGEYCRHEELAARLLASRKISREEFIHELAQKRQTSLSKPECKIILEWLESSDRMDLDLFMGDDATLNFQGLRFFMDSQRKLRMMDLIASVESGNMEEARLLLEAGLDVKHVFHGFNSDAMSSRYRDFYRWHEVRSWSNTLEKMDVMNRSPLQLAAQKGNTEMVQLLISYGADVNEEPAPQWGVTAIQAAAIGGHLQTVTILWEKGANVNAAGAQQEGRTALEGAAEWGRIDMVQLLLLAGADIHKQSSFGKRQYENAVMYARGWGHHAVADLIERHRQTKA